MVIFLFSVYPCKALKRKRIMVIGLEIMTEPVIHVYTCNTKNDIHYIFLIMALKNTTFVCNISADMTHCLVLQSLYGNRLCDASLCVPFFFLMKLTLSNSESALLGQAVINWVSIEF